MLLKWLFTLLAIVWLYQALRPLLFPPKSSLPPRQPPPDNQGVQQKNRLDEDGEYIDYEDVK